MKDDRLFLSSVLSVLAAVSGFSSTAAAQAADSISSIDGDSGFASDSQFRYFNREHCGLDAAGGSAGTGGAGGDAGASGAGGMGGAGGAGGAMTAAVLKADPSEVSFEIRLDQTTSVTDVYLWIGKAGAKCEVLEERNETAQLCAELAGNPRRVGSNFTISGLVLQDLLDAQAGGTPIANCESSGLTGTEYQIFVFRDAPAGLVDPSRYGIAPFYIDVQAPESPAVNTTPQRQSNFEISWSTPDPPDLIGLWELWAADSDDPDSATSLNINSTAPNANSLSVEASQLGLSDGESAYLYVRAYDDAYVSNRLDGNLGELSDGVMVTAVNVAGYCDASGDCNGCSVLPSTLAGGGPGSVALVLGFMFAAICAWRFRR